MSPTERAKAAHAAAEAADHPRDRAALKAAAGAWEQIARGGTPWSHRPAQTDLKALQRELAIATGPCQPPKPPKAPAPAQARVRGPDLLGSLLAEAAVATGKDGPRHPQEATIEF